MQKEQEDILLRIIASILIVIFLFFTIRWAFSCSEDIVSYNGEERVVRVACRYVEEKTDDDAKIDGVRIIRENRVDDMYVRVEYQKGHKKYVDWVCFEKKWLCFYKLKGMEKKMIGC